MADTVITPLHWEMILDGIFERSCVPFLGAAVNISSASRDYEGLPVGKDVALRLIEKLIGLKVEKVEDLAKVTVLSKELKQAELDQDLAQLGFQNLPRVALHVEVGGLGKRAYLIERLRAILPDEKCKPSKLLETLAQLPFGLIVTTNFDRLLERALDRAVEKSLPIGVGDLKDPPRLALELRDAADPLTQYLRAQFSPATRQLLDAYDGAAPPPEDLQKALAEELNRLLQGDSLYEEQRFTQVMLTDEIWELIARNPDGKDRIRLNRLLLEEAYPFRIAKSRKPYRLVVQPIDGFKGAEQNEQLTNPPKEDVPVVYKIHGTFHEDKTGAANGNEQIPSDIIITEEDYIRFLTIVGKPGEGVPPYIQEKMVDSSLLFLGYSLEDWDFRTLYKGLIERLPANKNRTSFAIQWRPPKFWVKYWEQKGVAIYDYDIYDFAEELEWRYIVRYGSLSASKEQE